MKPLLEVRNLGVDISTKRGIVRAVRDVSFALNQGRTLGVVGESGCGKSMLCRALMRLLPPGGRLTDGTEIDFDSTGITGLSERRMNEVRGREIAMIFQDPMTALNPVMKIGKQVGENLLRHSECYKKSVRDRVVELLETVAMPNADRCVDCYPHQLSGGMRQRAVIAIALALKPRLLIADEPTTALDVTVQAEILKLLDSLKESFGMAMILVTHDLGVVASHADEVAVMYGGRVVEHAPTPELFSRMRHPYTKALMEAIPRLTTPAHEPLKTIEGQPPDLVSAPPGCVFSERCPVAREKCFDEQPPVSLNGGGLHRFTCHYPNVVGGEDG